MECSFQVGDEVVCVGLDLPGDAYRNPRFQFPEIGRAYVIRSVFKAPSDWAYAEAYPVFVRLKEIRCPFSPGDGAESGFPFQWFSKVEKKKQEASIEIFKEIDRRVFERVPVESFL